MTREQLNAEFQHLCQMMVMAGLSMNHDREPVEITRAHAEAREIAGLEIDRQAWACFVMAADRSDRLAACDRDELVAEAEFIQEANAERHERWEREYDEAADDLHDPDDE